MTKKGRFFKNETIVTFSLCFERAAAVARMVFESSLDYEL